MFCTACKLDLKIYSSCYILQTAIVKKLTCVQKNTFLYFWFRDLFYRSITVLFTQTLLLFFLFWWYEVYLTMKSIWRTLKAARYSYDYQRLNDWIWHSWWRERENRICVKYIYWHSDAEHLSKITLICRTLPKELHRKREIPCLVFVRLI